MTMTYHNDISQWLELLSYIILVMTYRNDMKSLWPIIMTWQHNDVARDNVTPNQDPNKWKHWQLLYTFQIHTGDRPTHWINTGCTRRICTINETHGQGQCALRSTRYAIRTTHYVHMVTWTSVKLRFECQKIAKKLDLFFNWQKLNRNHDRYFDSS